MSMFCIINSLKQTAFTNLFAAITDIRWSESCCTDFTNKLLTMLIAVRAQLTVLGRFARTIFTTYIFITAVKSVLTFIEWIARMTCCDFRRVLFYFSRNHRWILTKVTRNSFNGHTFLQFLLKVKTILISKELRHSVLLIRRQQSEDNNYVTINQ